jgi:protein transport protein SEC20
LGFATLVALLHRTQIAHTRVHANTRHYAMTSNLTNQLATLSDSLKAIDDLIKRLSSLTFHPGSEPLTDANSVRVELAQDIHDSLKQLEEELELLKQEAEDLTSTSHAGGTPGLRGRRESVNDRDRDRSRLNAHISRLAEDLRTSRAHFRRAQLNAKKASELAKQKEREAVFASLQNPPPPHSSNGDEKGDRNDLFAGRRSKPQQQQKSQEQQEIDASASVTTALRRTHNLLSTELSRSRFAQETFDQSTAALAELGERYTSLDSVLKNSRDLLGTLLRSQKSDTWYLETAFYILITTLIWLIFRRILLGPFVRLPLFVLRWFLWRPVVGVLYLTGVVTTEVVSASTTTVARASRSTTRTPLIVQPSAAGRGDIPRIDEQMAEKLRQQGGVPVGAGGSHAKQREDGRGNLHNEKGQGEDDAVLDGEMSERIGRMAQESQNEEEQIRRGDGTVLRDRGEEPPNRKKKMFDADVEDAKYEQQQQQQQQRHTEPRKRDEL